MELFTKLFGNLLIFVYHCFDRIVIHGYLSGLSRPEQVVHFFRRIVGVAANWDASLGLVVDIAPSFREKLGHRATDFLACIVESGLVNSDEFAKFVSGQPVQYPGDAELRFVVVRKRL